MSRIAPEGGWRRGSSVELYLDFRGGRGGRREYRSLAGAARRSHPAWPARPQLLIVDGAPGLENAIAAVWDGVPVQRCTVHKHRNLLAHAPERLHEEISADYNAMIYAATREEVERQRKAFIRKCRLKHRPVADSDRCGLHSRFFG